MVASFHHLEALMSVIGDALRTIIMRKMMMVFPDCGVAMLLFHPDGEVECISNADKEEVLVAMQEFIAANQARRN